MRTLLIALLAAFPHALRAEIYSWQEPQSGATRISNIAPAWYRLPYSAVPARGPRVVVTLGATVIDDTALPLEKRVQLASPSSKGSSAKR